MTAKRTATFLFLWVHSSLGLRPILVMIPVAFSEKGASASKYAWKFFHRIIFKHQLFSTTKRRRWRGCRRCRRCRRLTSETPFQSDKRENVSFRRDTWEKRWKKTHFVSNDFYSYDAWNEIMVVESLGRRRQNVNFEYLKKIQFSRFFKNKFEMKLEVITFL